MFLFRWMMLSLLLALLASRAPAQNDIPYEPLRDAKASLETALQTAKTEGKRLWVQIGDPDCPACKRLYWFLEAHPDLADVLHQHFVAVHVGISRENIPLFRSWDTPQLTHGVPVVLVLDAEGKVLTAAPAKAFTAAVGEFSEAALLEFLQRWRAAAPPAS